MTGPSRWEAGAGFASVRTEPREYGQGNYVGLLLRLRGDGKRYKVRVNMSTAFDAVGCQLPFATQAGAWITVRAPFEEFAATYHERPVRDAVPIDSAQIGRIGLLISDGQASHFRLGIDWIKAYRPKPQKVEPPTE